MKKVVRKLAFLAAILLAGFFGFATASDWLPPVQSAAVQVDVNLTQTPAPSVTNKVHETEPEEVPSKDDIEVEIVSHERELGAPFRVLIYHSHTYEAYEPDFPGQYKATERWRTADPAFNVVRVGAELARVLGNIYGMTVVHDDTAFEPPRLDGAYQRSLDAIENYMAKGETFDLYLDLHRDAYVQGAFASNVVDIEGIPTARIMFLIGKGTGTHDGHAFAQLPDWEKNFERAQLITNAINTVAESTGRPVSTKASRYNQHVSTGALLVEVGNNMNTLEEALAAIPYLAQAIAETACGAHPMTQYPVANN